MASVGVIERAKLAAVDKGLQSLFHILEIHCTAKRCVRDIIRKGGCFGRVSLKGADDVHPVQGVEVVEMDQVILLVLGPVQKIPQDACVVRNPYFNCIFNCPHRGQGMGVSSDPAGTLGKVMGIPWIPALQNDFNAPEHGA